MLAWVEKDIGRKYSHPLTESQPINDFLRYLELKDQCVGRADYTHWRSIVASARHRKCGDLVFNILSGAIAFLAAWVRGSCFFQHPKCGVFVLLWAIQFFRWGLLSTVPEPIHLIATFDIILLMPLNWSLRHASLGFRVVSCDGWFVRWHSYQLWSPMGRHIIC